MNEYSIKDLITFQRGNGENPFGIYKPEKFWEDYGTAFKTGSVKKAGDVMKEFTVNDLETYAKDKIKENILGEYKPESFWNEYGRIYRDTFGRTTDEEVQKAVFLNIPQLVGRIKELQKDIKIEKVLEVGCGFGRCLPFVLHNCKLNEIWGLEFSPTMIEQSKEYLVDYERAKDIHLVQGKAQQIPFLDRSFDLVYTHVCLTHIPPEDIEQVVNEITRVTDKVIIHLERFAYPYEHPNPHRWSHMLPFYYQKLNWEIVEYDLANEEHFTKVLTLVRR